MRDGGRLHRRLRWADLIGLAMVAILVVMGGAMTLAMTRKGMHGGPDAVAYLSATHNIAAGEGITMPFETLTEQYIPSRAAAFDGRIPIVLATPGYPIVTGTVAALGLGDITATRIVNAGVIMLGLAAAAWMLAVMSRSWFVTAAGIAMIIFAPAEDVFGVTQSWIGLATGPASEIPFIATSLLAIAMIAMYLTRPRARWGAAAVAAIVLALMSRYVGASLVLTFAVALLLYGVGSLRSRTLRAFLLPAAALVPTSAWIIANGILLDANRPRAIAFHPPPLAEYETAAISFADWFIPGSGGGLRLVGLAVLVIGATLLVRAAFRLLPVRNTDDALGGHVFRVLLLYVPCYLALLLTTKVLFDAGVPLRGKSITPLQPVIYLILITAAWRIAAERLGARRDTLVRMVPAAVIATAVIALGFGPAWSHARDAYEPTLLPPPTSEDARILGRIPEQRLVVSNAPDQVFNLAQRPAIAVPLTTDATTGEPNDSYETEVLDLGRLLRRTGGDLVLFRGRSFGGELPAMLGLVPRESSATLDVWTAADARVQRSSAGGAESSETYRRARVGS